ncbi:hypothetical protein KDH_64120 [Dictyobacter sp. S3.2.2.5]|uniref:Uncharacterized protein n=1 Tax=Dictyobacter halimunensis TaxID=3026934 RepID=A0ABQ6G453_9CHLR|nr:hypothetical protein KDH_64120 [Dictyobacter sp. S3.2.2.5]
MSPVRPIRRRLIRRLIRTTSPITGATRSNKGISTNKETDVITSVFKIVVVAFALAAIPHAPILWAGMKKGICREGR